MWKCPKKSSSLSREKSNIFGWVTFKKNAASYLLGGANVTQVHAAQILVKIAKLIFLTSLFEHAATISTFC